MAAKLPTMQSFRDGHKIGKDPYQWIIFHPKSCKQRAKHTVTRQYTYITQKENLPWELGQCGLSAEEQSQLLASV